MESGSGKLPVAHSLVRHVVIGLKLNRFRNHFESQLATPAANLVLLVGGNGAGKTSVLEALHLMATGRAIRSRRDRELVKFGAQGFRVSALVEKRDDSRLISRYELGVRYEKSGVRRAFVDNEPCRSWGEFVGRLTVSLLRPDDIELLEGGPEFRRRFLDIMLCQIDREYFAALGRFRRAARQRAKTVGSRVSSALSRSFSSLMREEMPLLFSAREKAVIRLREESRPLMVAMGMRGVLELHYKPALPARCRYPAESGNDWNEISRACMDEDERLLFHGSPAMFGPARDEIVIALDGVDLRKFGSQGQKRIISIVLRLAEARIMSDLGRSPVLLVDDVMGELDEERRRGFWQVVKSCNYQTWVATTHSIAASESWSERAEFGINNGEIQEVVPLC